MMVHQPGHVRVHAVVVGQVVNEDHRRLVGDQFPAMDVGHQEEDGPGGSDGPVGDAEHPDVAPLETVADVYQFGDGRVVSVHRLQVGVQFGDGAVAGIVGNGVGVEGAGVHAHGATLCRQPGLFRRGRQGDDVPLIVMHLPDVEPAGQGAQVLGATEGDTKDQGRLRNGRRGLGMDGQEG